MELLARKKTENIEKLVFSLFVQNWLGFPGLLVTVTAYAVTVSGNAES